MSDDSESPVRQGAGGYALPQLQKEIRDAGGASRRLNHGVP